MGSGKLSNAEIVEDANFLAERYDINNAKLLIETGSSEPRDSQNLEEKLAYVFHALSYVLRDQSVMAESRSSFK